MPKGMGSVKFIGREAELKFLNVLFSESGFDAAVKP